MLKIKYRKLCFLLCNKILPHILLLAHHNDSTVELKLPAHIGSTVSA